MFNQNQHDNDILDIPLYWKRENQRFNQHVYKKKGLINMIKKLIIHRHPKVVEKREPEVLINMIINYQ